VIVRDAAPADLPHLAPVADQPLLARYGTTRGGLAGALADALSRGDGLLVADAPGPVGFAWYLPSGTLALGGYLRLIALLPGHESRGVGSLLLDEVERRVTLTSPHLFLLVSHFNEAAQRFYTRRGYASVGTLPSLVRPDIDEILMWRRLRP
jgi:ribosomal protein S18 acetylase RimI-like enzyme